MNLILLMCRSHLQRYGAEAEQVVHDPDYAAFHPSLYVFEESITDFACKDALILCDDPSLAAKLSARGFPAAGWLHPDAGAVHFTGVPFVFSEIDQIEPDTYVKVYQRLHHLPWTILTTARCKVREMTVHDLPGLYRLYDDPQARRFLEGPGEDYEREKDMLQAYIDRVYGFYGYGYWAVTQQDDLIGRVGFEPCKGNADAVSFGYLLRRDKRRQGLAKEVCSAVLQYAAQNLDFPSIEADTATDNTASKALLHALHFTFVKKEDKMEIWRYDQNAKSVIGT